MSMFKYSNKLILQIFFVIIFFSTLQAKNLDKFNDGDDISDYFSGILLLNDNRYKESFRYLKRLGGLEESHPNFSSKYLLTLVNSEKFDEAFRYAKKIEKKKLNNFESDLIIGVYYLKNKKYDLAQKYFLKIKNNKSKFIINNFISSSLLNWVDFVNLDFNNAQIKIESMDPKFENLKSIQHVFLNCFYKTKNTEMIFENLISNEKIDFSRYNYFYATYLMNSGKILKAQKIVNSSLEQYPRNLLLNQYKLDFKNNMDQSNFNCQNISHVAAEVLYISANALSSQYIYESSNFYLNLSKYLNDDFYSFDTLLAENYYKTKNFDKAKKIYNKVGKKGKIFSWYAAKQNAKILIKEKKNEEAIKNLTNAYDQLPEKSIYEKFDYAKFLKNNDQYEDSIKLYTEIIQKIDKNHPLYPKVMDGRGVSYERLGKWKDAENDLLSSLEVSPDQAYVINYLAYSWIEKGIKIEKSLKMLEKANNLRSNDPYITDSLGWALFKLGRYTESEKYLQLAIKLMPGDPVINDHYGDVLWKNGNKIQARYYWKNTLYLEDVEDDMKDKIENKLVLGL